jgi:HAMP domain-containing protein/predicted Ser/Thr protein kinase
MASSDTAIQKIGRYEVDALVGVGGMAKVYRAHDPEIGRIVAIKMLKDDLNIDEEYSSRFLREAQAAGGISHPNIVTIFDVGRQDGTPYITMEFLDEESLADLFAKKERLPVKKVVKLGAQLARALDHAHRKGIVHRDIKPGNILLMEGGQSVKITDFGIARLNSSDEMQKTHAGTVLGTPRYMSPEQATGQELDGRSDLFSLGVILYEMLTGSKAFDSDNIPTLMLQILRKDPTPVRTLAPNVPLGLQRIVAKLLQKKPEKRYATGAELAEALDREYEALTLQEEEAGQNKFVSLRTKWAAILGGAIAVVFFVCMAVIYYVESNVIRGQVVNSGAALARFVSSQAAVPVLSQDWVPLELFVDDAKARGSFDYLVITDHDGVVRASTEEGLAETTYALPDGAQPIVEQQDLITYEAGLPSGITAFLFDTPILFQQTEIGRVYLGVNRAGMDAVLRSTLFLLAIGGIATVILVVAMLYIFGGLLARPIRRLGRMLASLGEGDLDSRISENRNDELGEVFRAFNVMADKLQTRFAGGVAPAAGVEVAPEEPMLDFEGDAESTLVMQAKAQKAAS